MSTRRTLFLDPWSGISGDMFLASLIDSDSGNGRLELVLRETVAALGLDGVDVEIARDTEWGVRCTRLRVSEGRTHPLRHLRQMEEVLAGAAVSEQVRAEAGAALRRLAEVEAGIHGCSIDEIHFHEVGAADTLVDVVGAFALIEALAIERTVVGTIPVGGGTVEIAHGRMGVPAPATARLLEGYRVVGGPEMRELTTPTGALIVEQLGAVQGHLPAVTIEAVGYGAGSIKLKTGPNLLRCVIGAAAEERGSGQGRPADEVVELQTNVDDATPEVLGHAAAVLREAGALDVWMVPASMKKGRMGTVLHVLVPAALEASLVTVLFAETGTLGIRRQPVARQVAERGTVEVEVLGSPVRVKWGRWEGRVTSLSAEYEDCVSVAAATQVAVKDVMQMAAARAHRLLDDAPEPC